MITFSFYTFFSMYLYVIGFFSGKKQSKDIERKCVQNDILRAKDCDNRHSITISLYL